MKYIIRGLSFFLIPIIVNGILVFLRQPKKAEKGKVYLPKFFAILGVITSAIFLIPTFITAFSDESLWIPILFFVFSMLGATLIIAFINCRISYDEDGFVAKNFFGIKRKFTYDQITAIKKNMYEDYIYIDKRKIMVDKFSIGGSDFIAFVEKEYRKLHNGQALPKIRKTKHDIFNGNVNGAGGFIFVYILLSVFILAFAVFIVWYVYFTPSTVDNTIEQQLTFNSYVIDNEDIVLTSSDDQIYKIRFIDERFDIAKVTGICDNQTVVTAYSKKITPDDEDDYYFVNAILHDGTYLLSFDETNRLHRQEYWSLIFFPIIFGVVWGAYIAVSIIIGRNPKKFSKKLVKLFFKDGYVNY